MILAPSFMTMSTWVRTVWRPDTKGWHREEYKAGASFLRLSAVFRPESETFRASCARVKLAW